MGNGPFRIVLLSVLALSILLTAGCMVRVGDFEVQLGDIDRVDIGETIDMEYALPLDDIERAVVELRMTSGRLNLEGGASDLLQAAFEYNVQEWEPTIEYAKDGDLGNLRIEQPINVTIGDGEARNEWTLRLNQDVPMDLTVQLGAGEAQLDVRGMDLRQLKVQMGAGRVHVDLSGNWQKDFSVDIERGVGEATLLLPSESGVRIAATSALGEVILKGLEKQGDFYVNQAYGVSDVTIDIDVIGAVGSLRLEVVE